MGGERRWSGGSGLALAPAGEESQADTALRARGRWPPGKATCKAGVASRRTRTNERTAAERAELVVSGLVLNWSAAVGRFRVVRGWRLGNAAIFLGVSRGGGLVGRRRGPGKF